MLILGMLMVILTALLVGVKQRDRSSGLLLLLCLSFVLMFSGALTYIAKIGGYTRGQALLLFLFPNLQEFLAYYPITLDKLGYLVAVGRFSYLYFLLLIAMEYSMIPFVRRHLRGLRLAAAVCPALLLVFYYPTIFQNLIGKRLWLLEPVSTASLVLVCLYILLALALWLVEYHAITIPFCRRNFSFMLLAQISLTALYMMFAVQDPGQIYNIYVSEYLSIGSLSYIRRSFTGYGWIGLLLTLVFFVGLGTVSFIRYASFAQKSQQEDIALKRKYDASRLGASVFIHSIKNQLLSNRVLGRKLREELSAAQPDLQLISQYVEQLGVHNEKMLERMNELYRNIKSNQIELAPLSSHEIILRAVERFGEKYPEARLKLQEEAQAELLADRSHLSEALYNLLTNAWEAVLARYGEQAVEQGALRLTVHDERLYLMFEVADNGSGIAHHEQRRIFEPFFTSKNSASNWGMGLFYVRQIVKSHFGNLEVQSEADMGTSFYMMMPRYSPRLQRNPGPSTKRRSLVEAQEQDKVTEWADAFNVKNAAETQLESSQTQAPGKQAETQLESSQLRAASKQGGADL